MRRYSTLLSLTVATSVFVAPLVVPDTAAAGMLTGDAPAEGQEDPALAQAKELYQQGENKFQTADYEDALALWKEAFAILPDGDEHRAIRHALVYNIAEAHRQAYEVSRNPTHLRKAKILLENYRTDHRALYGDEAAAVEERAEVDERIAQLDKLIAESEAAGEKPQPIVDPNQGGGGTGTGTDTGTDPTPEPKDPPEPKTPKEQWEYEVKSDPVLGPKWVQSNKRIVGGAILTGIGSVFAVISVLAFIGAPNADNFPGVYWAAGGVTGAIGLGLLIPGAVLLGKGAAQRRQVLKAKPRPTGSLVPYLAPGGGGGVGYVLRF